MKAGILFYKCDFYRRAIVDGEPSGDYYLVCSRRAAMPRGNGALAVEAGQQVDRRDVRILVRDGAAMRMVEAGWRVKLTGRNYVVSSVSPPQVRDRSIEIILSAHAGEEF